MPSDLKTIFDEAKAEAFKRLDDIVVAQSEVKKPAYGPRPGEKQEAPEFYTQVMPLVGLVLAEINADPSLKAEVFPQGKNGSYFADYGGSNSYWQFKMKLTTKEGEPLGESVFHLSARHITQGSAYGGSFYDLDKPETRTALAKALVEGAANFAGRQAAIQKNKPALEKLGLGFL